MAQAVWLVLGIVESTNIPSKLRVCVPRCHCFCPSQTFFPKFLMGTSMPLKTKVYAKHLSVIPFASKTRSGWEADLESAQVYQGDKILAGMAA